ncbi:MAG: hypothetical protein LAN70_05645 [Acidobacteriia bacterium]|nr:hypothetical protein [Terriglobia bacterium]
MVDGKSIVDCRLTISKGLWAVRALSIIRRRLATVGAIDRLPSTIDYRPSTFRLLL